MLSLLLLYYGVATLGLYYEAWYPMEMVIKESVISSEPTEKSFILGKIAAGERVRVYRVQGQWALMQHEHHYGWVPSACIMSNDVKK